MILICLQSWMWLMLVIANWLKRQPGWKEDVLAQYLPAFFKENEEIWRCIDVEIWSYFWRPNCDQKMILCRRCIFVLTSWLETKVMTMSSQRHVPAGKMTMTWFYLYISLHGLTTFERLTFTHGLWYVAHATVIASSWIRFAAATSSCSRAAYGCRRATSGRSHFAAVSTTTVVWTPSFRHASYQN